MFPHELMFATEEATENLGAFPSPAPASRKRQLSLEALVSATTTFSGAFHHHLLQSEQPASESDTDSDGSQPKRLRYDSSPSTSPSRKPASGASRPNMSASHSITLAMLRPHFEEPLATVAKTFGICVTLLKKICRKHGLSRWPHRQITGLRKSIASMEHAIGYFEGARRDAYAEQLRKQKTKLALLLEDPTQCSPSLPSSPEASTDADATAAASSTVLPFSFLSRASSSPSSSLFDTATPAFPTTNFHATSFAATPSLSLVDHLRPSYDQQQQQQPVFASFSAPTSRFPSASSSITQSHQRLQWGGGSVCLPPLRTEPRRLLPPIASLVGNTSAW